MSALKPERRFLFGRLKTGTEMQENRNRRSEKTGTVVPTTYVTVNSLRNPTHMRVIIRRPRLQMCLRRFQRGVVLEIAHARRKNTRVDTLKAPPVLIYLTIARIMSNE